MQATQIEEQLNALADHLERQRNRLLRAWREAIHQDPELTTYSSIPRAALDDHIPRVLQAFERRLRAEGALNVSQVDAEQRISAAEHGSHRWQQGYDLRETIREWGYRNARSFWSSNNMLCGIRSSSLV